MKLVFDDIDEVYIWVEDHDPDLDLSPRFDEEAQAREWYSSMRNYFTHDLNEGINVVLPKNREHAEAMIRVANFYLDNVK